MPSTICAPMDFKSAGVMALTVASVPTGMKTGVRIRPWAVEIIPVRAELSLSLQESLKSMAAGLYRNESEYTSHRNGMSKELK